MTHTPETTIEIPSELDADGYFDAITGSDIYSREWNGIDSNPDFAHIPYKERRKQRRTLVAALAAKEIAGELPMDNDMTLRRQVLSVISLMPGYLDAQKTLDNERHKHESWGGKKQLVEIVTHFNHVIKGLVQNNESTTYPEIFDLLTSINRRMNGPESDEYFARNIEGVLRGVRHEIGVKQIIQTFPDIQFSESSDEEDMDGADFIIEMHTFDKDLRFRIDIKSSEGQEIAARRKAKQHGFDGSYIIWSGLDDTDFGDGFKVSPEAIERVRTYLYEKILSASDSRYLQEKEAS